MKSHKPPLLQRIFRAIARRARGIASWAEEIAFARKPSFLTRIYAFLDRAPRF